MDDSRPLAHRNGVVPVMAPHAGEIPSQLNALDTNNYYADIAQKHWLKTAKLGNVKPNVIKQDLWDKLEQDDFAYGSLLVLENSQILER